MSRKQPKKTNSESPESDSLEPGEQESVTEPAPDEDLDGLGQPSVRVDSIQDSESIEDDDFEEEEFSLDQLSQAYAEVLKQNQPDVDLAEMSPENEAAQSDPDDNEAVGESEGQGDHEQDDNAACPISPESIIEAILFVGAPKDVKLTSRKIAAVLRDVSPKEVTKTVRELNAKYEQENAAYRIESDGGVFKMIVDPKLEIFQREFYGRNREARLSQAAIDVMAVVAYNQPMTREQVEKIRSRPSGAVLAQLVRRELLNVAPGETNPKIKYFSTTDRFLDLFHLDEIADLPQSHEVSDIEELAD